MIRYSLVCEAGHEFESWFPSGDAYEAQRGRGLVSCPVCDSAKVEKALMAPSLGRKGNRAVEPAAAASPPPAITGEAQPVTLLSEREQALRGALRAVRAHVTRNSDYVGREFADEARKIHYGESEQRSIYGEADANEAKALIEEGIEVLPLPSIPGDRN